MQREETQGARCSKCHAHQLCLLRVVQYVLRGHGEGRSSHGGCASETGFLLSPSANAPIGLPPLMPLGSLAPLVAEKWTDDRSNTATDTSGAREPAAVPAWQTVVGAGGDFPYSFPLALSIGISGGLLGMLLRLSSRLSSMLAKPRQLKVKSSRGEKPAGRALQE